MAHAISDLTARAVYGSCAVAPGPPFRCTRCDLARIRPRDVRPVRCRHGTSLRSALRSSPCADQAITPRRRRAADGSGQPGRATERSTPSLVPAELARRRQTAELARHKDLRTTVARERRRRNDARGHARLEQLAIPVHVRRARACARVRAGNDLGDGCLHFLEGLPIAARRQRIPAFPIIIIFCICLAGRVPRSVPLSSASAAAFSCTSE